MELATRYFSFNTTKQIHLFVYREENFEKKRTFYFPVKPGHRPCRVVLTESEVGRRLLELSFLRSGRLPLRFYIVRFLTFLSITPLLTFPLRQTLF